MNTNDGRFPGGPTTEQIIADRKVHRCEHIWKGMVDAQHKSTRYHGQMMLHALREEGGPRHAKLESLGFGPISRLNWTYTDTNLCFAIAERFWPKTSTFHFPCGEMSITLDDTSRILGLPVVGKALVPIRCDDYLSLVTRCLGKIPEDITHIALISKGRIEFKWLIEEFHTLPYDATPDQVDYYTRAYILALCGCCLFPNASGRYVSLKLLTVLEDLDGGAYAWGAAVLACLYTSMKEFVFSDKWDLRGCVVLLQVWAHLHFPSIGTPVVRDDLHVSCLAEEFCGRNRVYTADPHHTLVYYRQELDLLTPYTVIWAPYPLWPEEVERYIAHRSCIIYLDQVHYHPVDRCMRQFRFYQEIPDEPMSWYSTNTRRKQACDIQRAVEDWNDLYENESRFRVIGRRLVPTELADGVSEAYKIWYGRPVLTNPKVTFSEPRFTPRGFGDSMASVLWTRCTNTSAALRRLYHSNISIEEIKQHILALSISLESPDGIHQVPQEPVIAPMRDIRFHTTQVGDVPEPHDEPYFPEHPMEHLLLFAL